APGRRRAEGPHQGEGRERRAARPGRIVRVAISPRLRNAAPKPSRNGLRTPRPRSCWPTSSGTSTSRTGKREKSERNRRRKKEPREPRRKSSKRKRKLKPEKSNRSRRRKRETGGRKKSESGR